MCFSVITDANLQDGECMYNLLMVSQESQRCLIPLFSLPVLNNVTNVNDMYSAAQDGKKLKCR